MDNAGSSPRIPTLDGWRGIAILMVLLSHGLEATRCHEWFIANLGPLGVNVFFVVSGYVITFGLLRERDLLGHISLRRFYVRRAYRILPVPMLYLSVLLCVARPLHLQAFQPVEIPVSLLFARNYWAAIHGSAGIYTGHFWSLSVEEHFYLLWPALLVILPMRWATRAAAVLIAASVLWRLHAYHSYSAESIGFVAMRTEFRLDGLLLGCLLAILLRNRRVRGFIYANFPKETPLLCVFLLILWYPQTLGLPSLLTYLLVTIALASTLVVEEGLAHRWLNVRPVLWLGTISYSLYIWQQLIAKRPTPTTRIFGIFSDAPFNIGLSIITAAVSFYLIEQPLRKLGRKHSRTTPIAQCAAGTPFRVVAGSGHRMNQQRPDAIAIADAIQDVVKETHSKSN